MAQLAEAPQLAGAMYPETFAVTAAQQIVDLTRVVSDASSAVPGRPINVQVIPGLLPAAPSISQLLASPLEAGNGLDPSQPVQPGALGALVSTELPLIDETFDNLEVAPVGGIPTTVNGTVEIAPTGDLKQSLLATLDGVVSTISDVVELGVSYTVTDANGNELRYGVDYTIPNAGTNPLAAGVLIRPPFADDAMLAPPTGFRIIVSIFVRVQLPAGGPHVDASKVVEIPVVLPAVRVPAVLLVGAQSGFGLGDERVAVVVRQASPARTVGDLVGAVNALMDVIGGLQAFLPLVPLVNGFRVLTEVIATAPRIYFALGDVADLEGLGDLRSTHGAVLLFGVEGTQLRFFDDTNWEDSTFDLVVPATEVGGLTVPVGWVYYPSLNDEWGNSPESLQWTGSVDLTSLSPFDATVPDVVEMTRSRANVKVEAAGLIPEFTGTDEPHRLVTRQSPPGGELTYKGTTVIMELGTGPFK